VALLVATVTAAAGPWDLAVGLLGLIATLGVAWIGLRASGQAKIAATASAQAKTATAAVASDVALVRSAVGIPNGLGSVTEALGISMSGRIGFFGTAPVAQQATPSLLSEVIDLLQAYGLCP